MKKLILIRHGEAEPETTKTADSERDLTVTGKQESAKMAAMLLNHIPAPDFMLTSTAVRASNTAHIFAATFGLDEIHANAEIYEATAETLFRVITGLDDEYNTVCLFGHNPGVSNLVHYLSGKVTTMPTSAWVLLELNLESWTEASNGTSSLIQYQYP